MTDNSHEPSRLDPAFVPSQSASTLLSPPVDSAATPVVPEHIRRLLGPNWIIAGEDPKLYEDLLARAGAAVRPIDIIDWQLVKDAVALTWEIHRSRRHRASVMRMARRDAMASILVAIKPLPSADCSPFDDAKNLSSKYFNGDRQAIRLVDKLFAQAGLSMADVDAQALSYKAAEFDRIDQQNSRHEQRRDALLQQIERRRPGWGKQVKRASEDVVDAEYTELAPGALSGRPDNGVLGQRR